MRVWVLRQPCSISILQNRERGNSREFSCVQHYRSVYALSLSDKKISFTTLLGQLFPKARAVLSEWTNNDEPSDAPSSKREPVCRSCWTRIQIMNDVVEFLSINSMLQSSLDLTFILFEGVVQSFNFFFV